jgi:malonyl-CoA/methylmalonyl-CoA synthetase
LTEKAFDSEGFFKSGDCAKKVGDSYVLYGRANIDGTKRVFQQLQLFLTPIIVLHFWGFTVHTGEVESALLSLPYIANAIALPLADTEYKERCAAILQLKPASQLKQPSFDALQAADSGLLASRRGRNLFDGKWKDLKDRCSKEVLW